MGETIEERVAREADVLEARWETHPRWQGVERPYSAEDVIRLRGSFVVEHTIARHGAERLWDLVHDTEYVNALGALTGGQAVEMVKAGLQAIYLSGWQVAADANLAGHTYPDQSLYPANSVPAVVRRINNAMQRADQIAWSEGDDTRSIVPILADAEAGLRRRAERVRAHAGHDRGRCRRACTSRTSSRARRSAVTSAARCSCRPTSSCARSRRRVWPPTCSACRRSWSRAPMPSPPP